MLSTQEILQAVTDMQANAQQALPIIPNNGNPRGANNMPQQVPHNTGIIPQAPSPMVERFPWLKPSASMDNVRAFLNNRRGTFQQPAVQTAPVIPMRT